MTTDAASPPPIARVALITGSTSGIGAEIARRLHREGWVVVVTGRSVERGEALVASLGSRALFVPADLTAAGAPEALVDAVLTRCGSLDALVNNAAIDHAAPLLEAGPEEIRSVFETNVLAAIGCLQAAARAMVAAGAATSRGGGSDAGGGSIVNITSRLATAGVPTMGVYGASKGALLALTTAAAVELAPLGIRVNAVAPGMTRTPLYEAWLASAPDTVAREAEVVSAIPLGRLASPADVAGAVAYLLSDEAAYVTGVSLPVDGGFLAR